MNIGQRFVERTLHDTDGARGEDETFEIEALHEDPDAAVQGPEDGRGGDEEPGEGQLRGVGAAHAEFVEFARHGEARRGGVDDEGGDAATGGLRVGVGLGVDDDGVGVGSVGDPHFAAVELPALFAGGARGGRGAGRHGDDVGAGAVFGHGEGADFLAGDESGEVRGLLRAAAVETELVDAELAVGGVGECDGRGGAGQFFHYDAVRLVA